MLQKFTFAFILCGILFSQLEAAFADSKPNVVFVLFDDLGYGQPPSFNSASTFKMPHFDQLVREGMKFTDVHSASGVCTPTRYGLMTGRYPSRIGQFGVLTTWSKPIIPTNRMTVASLMKSQGYETACIGKWHLGWNWDIPKPAGKDKENSDVPLGTTLQGGPCDLGFNYFLGYTHARNITTLVENNKVIKHVEAIDQQGMMIAKAVDWIKERKNSDKPFFLYFPMCPPHSPIIPAEMYQGKSQAEDKVGKDPKYGDWIFQGDDMLRQIVESLKNSGFADNTLLIVTSDNGAAGRSYPPLRESKSSVYEGGHRVPCVMRWPGVIKPGSVCQSTICHNDLLATLADLTGQKLPPDAGEDSFSYLNLLKDPASEAKRKFTIHQSAAGILAIRSGPWKLVFKGTQPGELYHLGDDLSETTNLAESRNDQVKALTQLMEQAIQQGRSTAGAPQQNEAEFKLFKNEKPAQDKKKKKEV